MWDPFYWWAFFLHESVQTRYKGFLLHLHLIGPRFFPMLGRQVVNFNNTGRSLAFGSKKKKNRRFFYFSFSLLKKKKTHLTALYRNLIYSWTHDIMDGKEDKESSQKQKCWNETWKSESRVLPLVSIDNRYTSCLERKLQTCGVFGLELSVNGDMNVT